MNYDELLKELITSGKSALDAQSIAEEEMRRMHAVDFNLPLEVVEALYPYAYDKGHYAGLAEVDYELGTFCAAVVDAFNVRKKEVQ